MSKTFRPWDVDQVWLLPPSIQDLVPSGHVAHFVRDTVRTGLDLSAIMDSYDEERGFPPGDGAPGRPQISEFRKRHLAALSGLFRQVLKLCREAGLVKLGHVALDGTKIKANAGINKAMSYGRMKEAEPRLAAEVQRWFAEAAQTDKAEDRQFGASKRGEEMPEWMAMGSMLGVLAFMLGFGQTTSAPHMAGCTRSFQEQADPHSSREAFTTGPACGGAYAADRAAAL